MGSGQNVCFPLPKQISRQVSYSRHKNLLAALGFCRSQQTKKNHGRSVPHDSLNAGMSAMAMLHSVSNCVCYGG